MAHSKNSKRDISGNRGDEKVCISVFEKQSSRGLIEYFTVHAPVSWKTSKTQEYTMLSSEDELQAPHGSRG